MDGNTNSNETTKEFLEIFGLGFCHLVDFPLDGVDCSESNSQECVKCLIHSRFVTEEKVTDPNSSAFILYSVIWVLIIFASIFGVLSNALVIMVLNRRKAKKSFDILLTVLSGVDIFCCVAAVFSSTGLVAYFGNWLDRGEASVYWYWMTSFGLLGRSGSTFMTVMITVERYLMITFPLRANSWFTPRKTGIMTLLVISFALFLNYPRFAGFSVEPNNLPADIPSLQTAPYILRLSEQGKFWYLTLDGITDQVDFWMPLPIILLFNMLSYFKVRDFLKRRSELSSRQRHDIRAVKMFLPVVVVYFLTNIEPLLNYGIIHFTQTLYRELYMLLFLSTTVNSAVNLPIYYFRSSGFKTETQNVVASCLERMGLAEMATSWKVEKINLYAMGTNNAPSDSGLQPTQASSIAL